jgi:alcohol dehydrogenase class IV
VVRLDRELRNTRTALTHYSHDSSNVRDEDVAAAHEAYSLAGCDAVLSLGGGSAHDTAKAVRVLVANGGTSVTGYSGRNPLRSPPSIPHFSVNTTSGTGAEVSSSYVYTDTRNPSSPRKRFVIDRLSVPTVAVDDPTLMLSQSPRLATYAGVDALTHAVEAFTALPAHPLARRDAAQAARLVLSAIEKSSEDPSDLAAMERMCLGQYLAGIAFSAAGLGLVHATSHALSAHFDLHHGLANAIALPHVIRYNAVTAPAGYVELAGVLGMSSAGAGTAAAVDGFVKAVTDLLARLGAPTSVALAIGDVVPADHHPRLLDDITAHILEDPCTGTNPRVVEDSSELRGLLRDIIGGETGPPGW